MSLLRRSGSYLSSIGADAARPIIGQRLIAAAPFLLVVFLFFFRLGHRDLYSSHEARAAQNAQRMLDTGEWGLPTLFDGRRDLQKPPLYYWLAAAAGYLNDGVVTEWVVRLPAALAGLVCTLLVYATLRRESGEGAAIAGMLVLATANHFTGISRTARIDVPLTCAVAASLLAFRLGCHPRTHRLSSRLGWHVVAALAAAVAVMSKGPVGLALICPAAAAWLLLEWLTLPRDERPHLPMASLVMISGIVALVALPWFVWANRATDGEFFQVFFWHHTIARFTGSSPQLATHPWWYYVPRFAVDFLPWTPALLVAVLWSIRSGHWKRDGLFRFSAMAFAVIVLVLSAARFKRADYLLPAYPFAAMAVAAAIPAWLDSRPRPSSVRVAQWAFGAAVVASTVGWLVMMVVVEPAEQAREEKRRFAEMIRTHAPAPATILQFRMESHLLSYHLGRPVHTFVEWGELNELLARPGPHFVVMPPEYVYPAGQIATSRKLVPIARLDEYTRGKPSRPLVFLRTMD
jgi:4-amino-4-deoxy-L-arabinose transferase-like glycosyltransferase